MEESETQSAQSTLSRARKLRRARDAAIYRDMCDSSTASPLPLFGGSWETKESTSSDDEEPTGRHLTTPRRWAPGTCMTECGQAHQCCCGPCDLTTRRMETLLSEEKSETLSQEDEPISSWYEPYSTNAREAWETSLTRASPTRASGAVGAYTGIGPEKDLFGGEMWAFVCGTQGRCSDGACGHCNI